VVVWNFSDNQRYAAPIRALGIPIHGFSAGLSTSNKLWHLRRLVLELTPKVLHSYSFYLNLAAQCAAYGTRTIPIGSVRSDFVSDRKDSGVLIGHLSARWPRHQVCNSMTAMALAGQTSDPFTPERLSVVRNGVDFKEIRWSPVSVGNRASLLGIGSLVSVKRWDRLVAAAAELKKRKLDFVLRIVGDGPLRSALEAQARDLGLDDRVEFIGQSDDIPRLLAESTFLAHTSDAEGCPNVIMEAMASGRPVVATDVGDASFLVEDGKTGFVVRRENIEKLVDCIALLIRDRDLCQRMGEAGRAKGLREFGLDRLVCETLAAYEAAGWRSSNGSPLSASV
jgi:glycosyltransferase involved in cell wall biosynthesis